MPPLSLRLNPLFIASAIADGVTETEVLLPDGASEHDYSLRPSDVTLTERGLSRLGWPGDGSVYAKTGKQITRSEAGNDCAA